MPTVSEIAVSLTGICTTVPTIRQGVCRICHGCPTPGWNVCWSCNSIRSQVSQPCDLVVPISLYEIPSQLHQILRYYKHEAHSSRRDVYRAQTVSLLAHFLAKHAHCIASHAGREWDLITSVPSSGERVGRHPLVDAINLVASLRTAHIPLLEKGSVQIDHRTANDGGFRVTRALSGERVLLVDDTYTAGSRAQSAASALALAGGDVVAIIPIGRVITPSYSDASGEYWSGQRRIPFSFDTCCLETTEEVQEDW